MENAKELDNTFDEEFLKKHLALKDRIDTLHNSIKLNQIYSNHLIDSLQKAEKEKHELILAVIDKGGEGMDKSLDLLIKIYSSKYITV